MGPAWENGKASNFTSILGVCPQLYIGLLSHYQVLGLFSIPVLMLNGIPTERVLPKHLDGSQENKLIINSCLGNNNTEHKG